MIKSAKKSKHLMIDVQIKEKRLRIMINSSVSENFIVTRYTDYHELFIQRKTVVYSLLTVNGSALNGRKVTKEMQITLKIDRHEERIKLDVINLISYDIILNIS